MGRIAFAVNNALPPDIRIVSAKEMPDDFHARFSAVGKQYIYRMKEKVGAFESRYYYEVPAGLDLEKMQRAAAYIKGTHDFKCFQAAGSDIKDSTVRTIFDISIERSCVHTVRTIFDISIERSCVHSNSLNEYTLVVSGDGFLYNMVRIITGTLVDAGRGRIEPDELPRIIESRDRTLAGHTAPPQGLYLAEVYYE